MIYLALYLWITGSFYIGFMAIILTPNKAKMKPYEWLIVFLWPISFPIALIIATITLWPKIIARFRK